MLQEQKYAEINKYNLFKHSDVDIYIRHIYLVDFVFVTQNNSSTYISLFFNTDSNTWQSHYCLLIFVNSTKKRKQIFHWVISV